MWFYDKIYVWKKWTSDWYPWYQIWSKSATSKTHPPEEKKGSLIYWKLKNESLTCFEPHNNITVALQIKRKFLPAAINLLHKCSSYKTAILKNPQNF